MDPNQSSTSCDDFQIALEKEAGGVLSAEERAELKEHVNGCSNCQRVQQLIESLRTMAIPEDATPAMDVVRRRQAHRRRFYLLMVALYVALTASAIVVFGPEWGLMHVGAGLFGVAVETYRYRKLNKLAAQHAQRQIEIFGTFRKEVLGRLRFLENKLFVLLPVVFALSGGQDLLDGRGLMGGYNIALAVMMTGVWLRARIVHLPRLRRELAELSRS